MQDQSVEYCAEICADTLSDVPSDAECENSISDSDSVVDLLSDLDISEKNVEDLPISYETSLQTKQDKIPVLEDFIGKPGVR